MRRLSRKELELMLGVALRVAPMWARRAYAGKTPDEQDRGAVVLANLLVTRLERHEVLAPPPEEPSDTHPPAMR